VTQVFLFGERHTHTPPIWQRQQIKDRWHQKETRFRVYSQKRTWSAELEAEEHIQVRRQILWHETDGNPRSNG
jgi:hypothetical protein